MNKRILENYNLVNSIIEKTGDEELKVLSAFLGDRIRNIDSYVMMLGETSSGKSSIINGLMEENTLFVSSTPSTGSITEVEFKDDIIENQLYAINKDATIERIDEDVFNQLIKKPDEELQRLKLVTKSTKYNLSNMRLFDTPGYGSIVREHEEVLMEFIPNSDVIIYTVNYKIGIQENDYAFLGFLKELIREDVEIILLINRCPVNFRESDKRIVEIRKYITDILHEDIKTFYIKTEFTEDEYGYPLPKSEELWKYVEGIINSPKRIKELEEAFECYTIDLLGKCENLIDKQYSNIKLSNIQKEQIKKRTEELINNINSVIPDLIEPTFDNLVETIPKNLAMAKYNVEEKVLSSIDNVSTANMDETISYVSNHLLPYSTSQETLEVKRYIEVKLEELNDEVSDYLNKEIMDFNKDIELTFSTATELAGKGIGKKVGSKMVTGALSNYFIKFGGAGGAGAGVANAASHALKVAGDFFGKTFTRETHNALKHTLSKIGATSTKFISSAAAVLVELATIIIDYSTWKSKLKNKTGKAINEWYNDTLEAVRNDLKELKKQNIETLKSIIEEETRKYNYDEEIKDEKEINKLIEELQVVKEKLGV